VLLVVVLRVVRLVGRIDLNLVDLRSMVTFPFAMQVLNPTVKYQLLLDLESEQPKLFPSWGAFCNTHPDIYGLQGSTVRKAVTNRKDYLKKLKRKDPTAYLRLYAKALKFFSVEEEEGEEGEEGEEEEEEEEEEDGDIELEEEEDDEDNHTQFEPATKPTPAKMSRSSRSSARSRSSAKSSLKSPPLRQPKFSPLPPPPALRTPAVHYDDEDEDDFEESVYGTFLFPIPSSSSSSSLKLTLWIGLVFR
jgi:hypothetical protein